MKRVIIVHCWEGYPEYCWYPNVKKQLEDKRFEVKVPAFPETELPEQKKWVPYLAEQIGMPRRKSERKVFSPWNQVLQTVKEAPTLQRSASIIT